MDIKQAYEHIINGPNGVSVFDCDSTVISGKKNQNGNIITTGEGLSDVALALGRRIGNMSIVQEVDNIAQKTMSTPGAVFEDSLNARFEILKKYGLARQDIVSGAEEAVFSHGFEAFIKLKDWLKKQGKLAYQPYFFLSGGFEEMLIECLSKVIPKETLVQILFANTFAYEGEMVTGFDAQKSKMYREGAKKSMVETLRLQGNIPLGFLVYGVGDGSNDITMSDQGFFVAYTGVTRREKVIEIAQGVEALNFYEIAIFHTSPEERAFVYESKNAQMIEILEKGRKSLFDRVGSLDIL